MSAELIKLGLGVISGLGGGLIVDNIVKITTPGTVGLIEKGLIKVGGFFLSGMVGDQVTSYTERQVDRVANMIAKSKVAMDEARKKKAEEKKEEKTDDRNG